MHHNQTTPRLTLAKLVKDSILVKVHLTLHKRHCGYSLILIESGIRTNFNLDFVFKLKLKVKIELRTAKWMKCNVQQNHYKNAKFSQMSKSDWSRRKLQ